MKASDHSLPPQSRLRASAASRELSRGDDPFNQPSPRHASEPASLVVVEPTTFTPIPDAIMRRRDLSLGARILYGRLRRYGMGGRCNPSVETLALELAKSPRQVQRYLRQLERVKLINTKKGRGRTKTSNYTVLLPEKKVANVSPFRGSNPLPKVTDVSSKKVTSVSPKETSGEETKTTQNSSSIQRSQAVSKARPMERAAAVAPPPRAKARPEALGPKTREARGQIFPSLLDPDYRAEKTAREVEKGTRCGVTDADLAEYIGQYGELMMARRRIRTPPLVVRQAIENLLEANRSPP